MMKILWLGLVIFPFLASSTAVASCEVPPDTRTWEEVTTDFVERMDGPNPFHGFDGLRLKKLDPKRAVQFLLPFLAKDQPDPLRMKAIAGLGQGLFQEAIPALSDIAKDVTDNEDVRALALNPGLRYMKSSVAFETAASVVSDNSRFVRTSAYCVLSQHGGDQAVKVLETRMMRNRDKSMFELKELISALYHTKHPRAGQIVFANCDFSILPPDENLLTAYSIAMDQYRLPEAQETMLLIARQPDCRFSTYFALRYFNSFPREDVVSALVAFINGKGNYSHLSLYETVTIFTNSSKITEESKKTLTNLITSGRVKKEEYFDVSK